MVIDFHEVTCDGTFLYAYTYYGKSTGRKLLTFLEEKNVLLENEYVDVVLRAKNGMLFSAFYAQWYMKLKDSVTTGMYFNDKKVLLVFTLESPKRGDFQERCRIIELIFEYFINLK